MGNVTNCEEAITQEAPCCDIKDKAIKQFLMVQVSESQLASSGGATLTVISYQTCVVCF